MILNVNGTENYTYETKLVLYLLIPLSNPSKKYLSHYIMHFRINYLRINKLVIKLFVNNIIFLLYLKFNMINSTVLFNFNYFY